MTEDRRVERRRADRKSPSSADYPGPLEGLPFESEPFSTFTGGGFARLLSLVIVAWHRARGHDQDATLFRRTMLTALFLAVGVMAVGGLILAALALLR